MIPAYVVDVFTKSLFKGNPAAVVLLDGPLEKHQMQSIASEYNLSETAFVLQREDNEYDIRWFTPLVEVNLCAHASMAAAKVLYEYGYRDSSQELVFHTPHSQIGASCVEGKTWLNFAPMEVSSIPYPELEKALGVNAIFIGQVGLKFMVRVETLWELHSMRPNREALIDLGIRAVAVCCEDSTGSYDYHARYFAPIVGIDEDPVCGSSHLFLAPYWAKKYGKQDLIAYQASSRSGEVFVALRDKRLYLGGDCVVVSEGQLRLD